MYNDEKQGNVETTIHTCQIHEAKGIEASSPRLWASDTTQHYTSNTVVDAESTSLRNLPSTEQSMSLCHYTHPALNDPGCTNGHCQGSFLKCLPQALSLANSFIISGEATTTRTNAGKVPTARQKYTQCTLSVLDQYTEI